MVDRCERGSTGDRSRRSGRSKVEFVVEEVLRKGLEGPIAVRKDQRRKSTDKQRHHESC